jgi:hypothetical protein
MGQGVVFLMVSFALLVMWGAAERGWTPMSKKKCSSECTPVRFPALMGNWPWRWYFYGALAFAGAVCSLLLGHGWLYPPQAK